MTYKLDWNNIIIRIILFISKAKICDNEKNTSDVQDSSEQFKFQFFERNKTMFEELIVFLFKDK